jgi:hypothetical protein
LFDEFEIKQKVFFATKDGGSDVTKAVKDLHILSHTCGQHKFNSILKNQINKDSKIKQLLNDVATISSFFRRGKANRIFENIQREANLRSLKLIRPVSTRFNYFYYCLQRILKLKPYIIEITENFEDYCSNSKRKPPKFSLGDWIILEDLIQILECFEFAILLLSSESTPTASIYNEVYFALQLKLETLSNSLKTNEGKLLSKSLDDSLERETEKLSSTIEIAAFFDIRFKELKSYSEKDQKYLIGKALDLVKSLQSTRVVSRRNDSNISNLSKFLNRSVVSVESTSLDNEIEAYLKEPEGKLEDCPFEWWRKNELKYPTISKAAKKLLCIQVSSSSVERLFSSLSDIQNKKRNRLSFEILSALAFLKVNSTHWGFKSSNQLNQDFDSPFEVSKITQLSENAIIDLFERISLDEDELDFSDDDVDILDDEDENFD